MKQKSRRKKFFTNQKALAYLPISGTIPEPNLRPPADCQHNDRQMNEALKTNVGTIPTQLSLNRSLPDGQVFRRYADSRLLLNLI